MRSGGIAQIAADKRTDSTDRLDAALIASGGSTRAARGSAGRWDAGGDASAIFTVLGFVFLYAPIVSLIVFSFNESRLVTVWGGFSTKWYGELLRDPQILGSAWISLQVAVASATLAVVLGTLAAYVLTRFGRFRSARS